MKEPTEYLSYTREQARWRVIQVIQARLEFNKPDKSITIELATRIPDIAPADVRAIVYELTREKVVKMGRSSAPYVADREKAARIQAEEHRYVFIEAAEEWSAFYTREEAKYEISNKQKLSLALTAAKRELATYRTILLGIAVDKFNFDADNPDRRSGVAKSIHDALVRSGIADRLPTVPVIRTKLREAATKEADPLNEEY